MEYVSKKLGKTTVRVDTRSYNRGNQGGGSDSENYIERELLKPDEIPRTLKRGKNGKCIVFVDEFYPFFIDKFDTLNHPKISEVGSDRGETQKNNADITVDFAEIKVEREKHYAERQQKAHLISNAIMSGNYDENITFEESQENLTKEKLRQIFEVSDSEMVTINGDILLADNMNPDEFEEVV